jgi:hypothetical protein
VYEIPDGDRDSSWIAEWRALTGNPVRPDDQASWARWSYLPGSHKKAIGADQAHPDDDESGQEIRLLIAAGLGLLATLVIWLIQAPSHTAGFEHTVSQAFVLIVALVIGVVVAGLAYGAATTVDWIIQYRRTATARQSRLITLESFQTGTDNQFDPGKWVSPEGKLVTVATHTARMIEQSRAWGSSHLDTPPGPARSGRGGTPDG